MDATQCREARLGPWLYEAYVLITTIEGKLANLQATQQKITTDSVGPTIEKLVEQGKKAATQCDAEVLVVQVELGGESPYLCWGLVGNGSPRVSFGVKSPSFGAERPSFV